MESTGFMDESIRGKYVKYGQVERLKKSASVALCLRFAGHAHPYEGGLTGS